MKNKLFIPLILCVLAACNSEAEYSGKVETQQDLADCYKAGVHAFIDYKKREGFLSRNVEDLMLGAGDDYYLAEAQYAISLIMVDPAQSETFARGQLDLFANGGMAVTTIDAWKATCHLAYLTGEEVDWPDY